jgi:dipeptidyl aminopeptidase/acylaminoacyl peptidase
MHPLFRIILTALVLLAAGSLHGLPGEAPETSSQARLTPELLESLAVVRNAAISPDSRKVLYRLSVPWEAEDEAGAARGELRVVPSEGGAGKVIVAAASDPSSPSWSPDGRWIAFRSSRRWEKSSKRDDSNTRIFVMPADGGEGRPVTPDDLSASGYRWSPDSKSIAFVARDPLTEEEREAEERGEDWTVVEEDFRQRRLRVVDVKTGEVHEVTGPEMAVWEFDWAPDAKHLVLAVTDLPRTDDQYMRQRLVVVPAEGGEPRLLVPAKGKREHPRWSPEGGWIAYLDGTDKHDPSAGTLTVVRAMGGAPRALAPEAEVNFRSLAWTGEEEIAAVGEEGVQSLLALVSTGNGAMKRIVDRDLIVSSISVDREGKRFALVADTPRHPGEVFVLDPGAGGPRRLTSSNESLHGVPIGEQGVFRWKARDGWEIEGVLIKPVGFETGRRYPLLVTPHGGPEFASLNGWQASYVTLGQVAAARGYLVLRPNYRGSTGRGEAFSRGDHRDLGGAEFHDVLDGIRALAEKGWAYPDRVAIAGGSYGGYFAALGATRHSEVFAAAVVFAGITNWISFSGTSDIPVENSWVHWGVESYLDHMSLLWERSPLAHLKEARTPTLILHGANDARVPIGQGIELLTALRLKGVPVRMVSYPREGHGLRERAHRLDASYRVLDWLERYVGESRP